MPRSFAELIIKKNDAFFVPIFQPRWVNNIYFDTPGLDCFFDNLFGIGKRWKARVRWYDNQFGNIDSPILEFKWKQGHTGTKSSYPLPGFKIDRNNFNAVEWKKIICKEHLPEEAINKISGMQPVLLNSYKRSYFETINRKFRTTVDDQLEYYGLRPTWNCLIHKHKETLKTIVELKYNHEADTEAEKITNQFPFRLDKNSKFVSGMSYFRNSIAE